MAPRMVAAARSKAAWSAVGVEVMVWWVTCCHVC
jgi:hypothetical protein